MLTHWARDRARGATLPLEYVVKKQTPDTAALYGLGDRGVLAPGKKADVNVIDFDGLTLRMPRVARDLPAGGAPPPPGGRRLRRHHRERRGHPSPRRRHRRPPRPPPPRRPLTTATPTQTVLASK